MFCCPVKNEIFSTYSLYTYHLLHFEHKNGITIILNFCIELQAAGSGDPQNVYLQNRWLQEKAITFYSFSSKPFIKLHIFRREICMMNAVTKTKTCTV